MSTAIDWDKELGDCPCCGHAMHAQHRWTSGPGGAVRWCVAAGCPCRHAKLRACIQILPHVAPQFTCQGR